MKICDETISDFEISNGSRIAINIYPVHQKELENYYNNEFDASDDVLNKIMLKLYQYIILRILISMLDTLICLIWLIVKVTRNFLFVYSS